MGFTVIPRVDVFMEQKIDLFKILSVWSIPNTKRNEHRTRARLQGTDCLPSEHGKDTDGMHEIHEPTICDHAVDILPVVYCSSDIHVQE